MNLEDAINLKIEEHLKTYIEPIILTFEQNSISDLNAEANLELIRRFSNGVAFTTE